MKQLTQIVGTTFIMCFLWLRGVFFQPQHSYAETKRATNSSASDQGGIAFSRVIRKAYDL